MSVFDRLLGLPRDLMEEVAVVPCGGCHRGGERPMAALSQSLCTATISLPSLVTGATSSRRRLWSAHAVIGLVGCDNDCLTTLLEPLRVPDVVLVVPEDDDEQTVASRLAEEVARACAAPRSVTGRVVELDCRGMRCPQPIGELSRVSRDLDEGEAVSIRTDDLSFASDIEVWCRQTGFELEAVKEEGGVTRALVRRSLADDGELPVGFGQPVAAPPAEVALLPTTTLDCLGLKCPMPIVRLGQTARELGGGRIEVLADDPAFPSDLRAWCEQFGAELLALETSAEGSHRAEVHLEGEARSVADAPVVADEDHDGLPLIASLDQRELRSPMHIVKLGELAREHREAGVIELVASTAEIEADLKNWSARTGGRLLSVERRGADFVARVAVNLGQAAAAPPAPAPTEPSPPPPPPPPSGAIDAPAERLDCRGMRCPLPILRLNELHRRVGEVSIEIMADDPAFPADLEAWCQRRGAQVASIERRGDEFVALIRPATAAAAVPTSSPRPATAPTPPPVPAAALSGEDEVFDFRGLKCPMPILELSKKLGQTTADQAEVVADDPAFPTDLEAWCRAKGFDLEWSEQRSDGYHARLRRGG